MKTFLQIATNITTPLGLAGLIASIFFFILRQLLSTKLLRPVKSVHTFLIIRSVITGLFWLSLVALIISAVSYTVIKIFPHPDPYVWDRIDKIGIDDLATDLRARGSYPIQVLVCPTLDCDELADDFLRALGKANWRIVAPKGDLTPDYKGLHVSINRETTVAGHTLLEVLRQHHYEVELWGDENQSGQPTTFLLIGVKGHPGLPH